jgi:hypothetical protein
MRERYVDGLLESLGPIDSRVERAFRVIDRADYLDGFLDRRGATWT